MSADNKAVVRRFLEEFWNKGNLAVADEVLAADYIRRDVATPGFGTGRESEKRIATLYRGAFPDLSLAIETLIAEGDQVPARWTVRGTHEGDLGGLRATGKMVLRRRLRSGLGTPSANSSPHRTVAHGLCVSGHCSRQGQRLHSFSPGFDWRRTWQPSRLNKS